MLGSLPLLALVVIAYNLIVFLTKLTMESAVFSIALVSGSIWVITVGDLLLAFGLVLLFLELINATRTGSSTIINHALSMMVLLVALVEFIVLPQFGTSVFFLLVLLAVLDVIAGFTVTITSARRDFSVSE
ncbi:MAG: hypothetical protein P4L72_13735 [Parvibaculum sp.]|jgi:hypothetical protein|uniref:hypothetical protein n=1 Tax=Parvibaculum sp. TaxID=2024848 RepID=UPI000DCC6559|nr:hypothetical protein [Parvibaculum sp.]MDR3500277.1 hypothetical protein [Parvibaculum sp.]RAW03954.1 hypothetical protein DBT41_10255 [Aerococcus urinae]